ncbi:MAG: alpha/beta fold hydrolase [Bryobacteraceae bacterium]|nr:alpha/beta fold hydrolase [Solibacteraceae bacterium]MCO5350485.1 alpha/beta fold hydrolase [Bryobacteraceae bacterium]
MPRRIESLMIEGPAGRLEALLEEPEGGEPRQAALVCHPHPLHGGTMHNKATHRLARGLRRAGAVVLRFNFRGVNLSEGEHDNGRGETEDARAALEVLRDRYPALPFTLAGFSFGSRVAIRLASQWTGPSPRRLILAGYPTVYRQHELLTRVTVPRIFVHSTMDEFGPRKDLQSLYNQLWEPKQLHWIDAEDHFFGGSLDAFELKVAEVAA